MFGQRKHVDQRVRDLEWRRDLAIACGMWETAAHYERELKQALRPGEREQTNDERGLTPA